MQTTRYRYRDLVPAPWKNGGGVTREIVSQPPGAGMDGFDWRVSVAHIARDGPFSPFAGVDRVITLLDGPGVRLHSADGALDHRLDKPLEPFAFAGELAVQAQLLEADCLDFNVMTRRACWRSQVSVLRASAGLDACAQGLLYAVRGRWQAQACDSEHVLASGEGLWWQQSEDCPWQLATTDTDAALIAVLIQPVTP